MGPRQSFKGVWVQGMETSSFTNCSWGFEDCRTVGYGKPDCWLDGVGHPDSGWQKFLTKEQMSPGMTTYIEFEGRESLKRGSYGHLGEYSCLIEVEKLTVAKSVDLSTSVGKN